MANKKAKKWQPVSIGSQFTLIRGRESKSTIQEEGDLPFVSAKKTNNGYRMFVNTSKTVVNGNTISLNNNGDGGAGFGYYQPYKYTIDVNTTALIPKDNMCFNKHIGLFWSGCFTWMHDFFGNARTLSNQRASGTQIMVPINEAGQPDCEFMAEYSKEKQKELLSRYKVFLKNRLLKLNLKRFLH